jgi:hypothetical protein
VASVDDDACARLGVATREIRPDRDLGAAGLRDAWDAGDRSPFHGWDKEVAAELQLGSGDGDTIRS